MLNLLEITNDDFDVPNCWVKDAAFKFITFSVYQLLDGCNQKIMIYLMVMI